MRNNLIRIIVFVIGVGLLAGSGILFLTSQNKEQQTAADNAAVCFFLKETVPSVTDGFIDGRTNVEMPTLYYDGRSYAALLEVPEFGISLPVCSTWDKAAAASVPCRFSGSPYDGTLIIGGVDAVGQFDFLSRFDVGDTVTVTDMNGVRFTYTVAAVRHAQDARTETLKDEGSPLTLFAKDRKTDQWLLVRFQ